MEGPALTGEGMMKGSILVVVAKYPTPGTSKTRLAKSGIGDAMAARFAFACVDDLLERFGRDLSKQVERLVLYFAPKTAKEKFEDRCVALCGKGVWEMMEMPSGDLKSAGLTGILEHGLVTCRETYGEDAAVAFCGMDAPLLSANAIITSLSVAKKGESCVCPANDGGYALLSVPPRAPAKQIFKNVSWSTTTTCASQIKQLKSCDISVRIGETFIDVDEFDDLVVINNVLSALRRQRESRDVPLRDDADDDDGGSSKNNSGLRHALGPSRAHRSPCPRVEKFVKDLKLLDGSLS
eukprot:g1341.t1